MKREKSGVSTPHDFKASKKQDSQAVKAKLQAKKAAAKAKKLEMREAKRLLKHGPRAQTSFKRNIVPILAGLGVMVVILGALNGEWIVAQIRYRLDAPKTGTTVTAATVKKDAVPEDTKAPNPAAGPQLVIPAINVTAPLQLNQGTAEWQIQLGLRKGVVHYDGSANPGDTGNVVVFGHSSGQPWAPGNYKFVFTLLDKLKKDDVIYADYNGIRYTYKVTTTQVVSPTDTGVLTSGSDHEITLITCTPVGTSTNRLVVHAEQISPKPVDTKVNGKAAPSLKTLPGSAR